MPKNFDKIAVNFNSRNVEQLLLQLPLYQIFILITLAATLFIQLFYYLFFYARVAVKRQPQHSRPDQEPVSIVICARNEEENLRKNLPLIMEQAYPEYEVVVVNDCSEDGTADILSNFQKQYNNLRVTTVKVDEKFTHGKKLALTIGIKAAQHEFLLLTDADCYPNSTSWLHLMQENFIPTCNVTIGYGAYKPKKGALDKLVRCDTFFIGLQYLSFALAGIPYMGVGRNLAYRKSTFFANRGFASHYQLPSGDDDLFVSEVANGKNTLVEYRPQTITHSEQVSNFNAWTWQKLRHSVTSSRYKKGIKTLIWMEPITRVLLFATAIFLIAFTPLIWVGTGALVLRFIIQAIIFKVAQNRLLEKNLFLYSLAYDFASPFLYAFLGLKKTFSPKWN
ncbi:Glycosyltransferase, catalytic subunit of cellulose synthase and poly-beta-1,6-N-acetylglucosamine synthase [Williamwhitmania taraxaci]|uniref:Glycosyltransferase, catalytic subunit of cellulose synthase and poly-beta-1,6-N-acetylglucosamine synthase n=1 Tax=Williamwhitmania taraxaci TaxID=1640674 RepID=A0A1G6JIC6_9BACT|nr:Glycosyltransferase, catalytic subunit of cellulose synthase and poly-beta-1,6-N-acetylglucosamine synthase [Williamwhitmania taraxaci]